MKTHGRPIWYELGTAKGALATAGDFYGKVLGWQLQDAGMEGFDYHLAMAAGDMVAGLMEMPDDCAEVPPFWMLYFGVEDADASAEAISRAGGNIHRAPADIPGTGRFAIAADPQGAAFGILQPLPMEGGEGGNAFDPSKTGHGHWNELMSRDPEAGFTFYAGLFGWQKSEAMDMGGMGTYQLIAHDGADIGAIMGQGRAPTSCWMPYFGVNGTEAAMARITEQGGQIVHGLTEVPGGAYICIATDPQGAHFAVAGPKDAS